MRLQKQRPGERRAFVRGGTCPSPPRRPPSRGLGEGREGRLLFARPLWFATAPKRLDVREIEVGTLLCTIVRAVEVPIVAVDAGPLKWLPARRQEAADRRTAFEITGGHARRSNVNFRLAAQTMRNIRTISTPAFDSPRGAYRTKQEHNVKTLGRPRWLYRSFSPIRTITMSRSF